MNLNVAVPVVPSLERVSATDGTVGSGGPCFLNAMAGAEGCGCTSAAEMKKRVVIPLLPF